MSTVEEIVDVSSDQGWQRSALTLLTALTFAATAQLLWKAASIGWAWTSAKWLAALGLAAVASTVLIVLSLVAWRRSDFAFISAVRKLDTGMRRCRPVLWFLAVLLAILYPLLVLGPLGEAFSRFFIRLSIFWGLALVTSYILSALRRDSWHAWHVIATTIVLAVMYEAALLLMGISSYPLSLGWSEASRYYYASLFFGERLFGARLALPILHPSRYLLQSVPFLVPGLPLVAHRSWQVLLWFAIPTATVLLLVRRLRPLAAPVTWLVVGWGVLFLFQGPVYYHLLLGMLPLLWGFDARRFTRTLLLVVVGSIWCGISRVNWYPMPGLLACALYLLDDEAAAAGRGVRALVAPVIWFVTGTAIAAAASAIYVDVSGNDPSRFTTSFTSDLLWYRLLPNATYRPGVLLGVSLLIIPMALLVVHRIRSGAWRPSRIILAGLLGILGVLLAGGSVVSVKIGGGGDLHNMDAFILMLLVVGSHIVLGRAGHAQAASARGMPARLVWLAAAIPAAFVVTAGNALSGIDFAAASLALRDVRQAVQQTVDEGGEVLFLTQRHAIPFGSVGDVPVADDFEKVLLMEMAMGDNRAFLDQFYHDLEARRFALIVSEPVSLDLQGSAHAFGEENDVWVKRVSEPLLAAYTPVAKLKETGIWLLEPR